MGIPVKLEAFEGPLDLLLHLIEKNKINIYDIPIVEITDQYMEYIRQMKTESLDVMSEFLVMAATLLDIKSRMLLPPEVTEEGEEIDPREELVEKLLEYKMYKYMSFELRDRQEEAIDLSGTMQEVEHYISEKKHCMFREILTRRRGKLYKIVTFLTLLELMKEGKVEVEQEETFADIRIEWTGKEGMEPVSDGSDYD